MLALLAGVALLVADPVPAVSTQSLLAELADPRAIARFPDPPYRLLQASSYDRASTSPGDAKGWFANDDWGKYLRTERREGRTESVMMDAPGPGALVRLWSPNPKGVLRIYLDGAATPVLAAPMKELLEGTSLFGDAAKCGPMAGTRSRGWNLFLPVPFAARCVITIDEGDGVYYQADWRAYGPGVQVTTFTPADIPAESPHAGALGVAAPVGNQGLAAPIAPGESRVLFQQEQGSAACIDLVELALTPAAPGGDLSTLLLEATFDGERCVCCPITDLLSMARGAQCADARRWASFGDDGTLHASIAWPMPFRAAARVTLTNIGSTEVRAASAVRTTPWSWDERSMHFRAQWQRDPALHTRPMRDFRFLDATGRGVYAGDSLHVVNPVDAWWGEGDEKIWVDGEAFPSSFGTGTEDYYGYGWCFQAPFRHPLHSQTLCDGEQFGTNWGRTIVARLRGLDGIPFTKGIRMDMEVWHWAECDIAYAPTVFWYGIPGATATAGCDLQEARRGRIDPPPPFMLPGVVECEALPVRAISSGAARESQGMRSWGKDSFSAERQLWVRGKGIGDFVELAIPAPGSHPRRVTLYATRSWDYGIVQCSINGTDAGSPLDLFSGQVNKVMPTGAIDLGVHTPVDGVLLLRVTLVGANPGASGTRSFFGLDAVKIEAAAK